MATSRAKLEWTPARYKSFIVGILRSGTQRYPPKFEALDRAKTVKKINKKSGRLAQHYRCAGCDGEFTSTQIHADHIVPVVDPVKGFIDWNHYIPRLFCDTKNFQVLCIPCHDGKTAYEKSLRTKKT